MKFTSASTLPQSLHYTAAINGEYIRLVDQFFKIKLENGFNTPQRNTAGFKQLI